MKWHLIVLILAAGLITEAATIETCYQEAVRLRAAGDIQSAIEQVTQGIAQNEGSLELFAKSELLAAELYVDSGMLEAAVATARQAETLYTGTEFESNAKALYTKIKQLIEASETSE